MDLDDKEDPFSKGLLSPLQNATPVSKGHFKEFPKKWTEDMKTSLNTDNNNSIEQQILKDHNHNPNNNNVKEF